MKPKVLIVAAALIFGKTAMAQSQFIYDQQSATETTGGGVTGTIQGTQPLGQSFIPTLASVGFIRLAVSDTSFNDHGATLYVNLRSGSVTGPIISSTDPVVLADGFVGYVNFSFPTSAPVNPGTTYYFQPDVAAGDTWGFRTYDYNYPGGEAYYNGVANPGQDLWFREGVVAVPEPSSAMLGVLGFGMIAGAGWLRKRRSKSAPLAA